MDGVLCSCACYVQSAGSSVPRPRISRSSSRCATGPVTTWAAAMPEPATAGTPMPGQHESPQQSSPLTCIGVGRGRGQLTRAGDEG